MPSEQRKVLVPASLDLVDRAKLGINGLLGSLDPDLNYEPYMGMGAAICRIDNVGCSFPQDVCFCQCADLSDDSPCVYWSYWHLNDGQWVYSQVGAGAYKVQAGSVEGWLWGRGNPPQVISLAAICAPATSTPAPTATATRTNTPPPTSETATVPVASHTPEVASPTATDSPFETMTPSAMPLRNSPTAGPSATETVLSELSTETPQAEMGDRAPPGSSTTSYVLFAVLLIALASAAVVVRARQ